MRVCPICKRQAGGFAFIAPPLRASYSGNYKLCKFFCSRVCQDIYSNHFKEKKMIDLTKSEKDAIESALKPVGEYVSEIGMHRPLSNYTREEVLCLIEVAVSAYQEHMQSLETFDDEVPC